jgi:acylphosphatase
MSSVFLIIHVSGKVQGVFFRESARKKAEELGVRGTVRNLPDGRVELVAGGPKDAVEALASWCHQGPPPARVDHVEVGPVEEFTGHGFRVIR